MSFEPPISEYSSAGLKRHCDVAPSRGARKRRDSLRHMVFRNESDSSQPITDHHLNWEAFRAVFVQIRCLQEAAGPCR
jgi:hypothetical protein